jgi:hypothetical protein
MNYLKEIIKDPKNVWYFVQGKGRLKLYLNIPFLIRTHIKEQFEWRSSKAFACLVNKSCLGCGCDTPDLFMADKACSLSKFPEKVRINLVGNTRICYPKMKNKKEWFKFKKENKNELE